MDTNSNYLGHKTGFGTQSASLDFGVDVFGNDTGVRGSSDTGHGVVGRSESATGVRGEGKVGVQGNGVLGPGVVGVGGVDGVGYATAGVIGRGATRPSGDDGVKGPGLVGLAGGETPLPTERVTGNVGVFGKGASGQPILEHGRQSASSNPGPGVVGIGGAADLGGFQISAPGVVGFAGSVARPDLAQVDMLANSGVYGLGPVGMTGEGEIGVKGVGSGDCGGVFQSEAGPQIRLAPYRAHDPNNELSQVVPAAAMVIGRPQDSLPPVGQAGDLMSIIDGHGRCTLWFCVRASMEQPFDAAQWAQVLLGPSINHFGQSG